MEDDYLERAREIWQRCQFYVYIGLAMVLAVIAGFTYHRTAHSEAQQLANQQLYELIKNADEQNAEGALAVYQTMRQNGKFEELTYLAAFVLASLHVDNAQYQQAADILRPAAEGSDDSGVRHLAALRIAEALINTGDYTQAVEILTKYQPSSGRLQVVFEERAGDAEYAAGNITAANAAYERARALAADSAAFYEPLINIKRGALLSTPQAAAQAALDAESENNVDSENTAPPDDTVESAGDTQPPAGNESDNESDNENE